MLVSARVNLMLLLRRAFLLLALLLTIPIGCYKIRDEIDKRGGIPRKLQQGWFYAEGACNRFLSYQGAYAISLTDDTVKALKEQGINFFSDINPPNNKAADDYFRGDWKATPIPKDFHSEGAVPNLYCGQEYSWLWPKGIVEALDRPGSYYLGTSRRNLYVIPDLGLVVASGSDR
jgi:hypothetical protein